MTSFATELRSVTVSFTRHGIEYAVTYAHRDEPPNPGTRARTAKASRMARRGLELALEELESDPLLVWGGFGTDTRTTRDRVLAEAKKREAG